MLEAGKIHIEKMAQFEGHKDCLYSLETLGRDSEFVSCGADGMVVVWNINQPDQGRLLAKVPGSVYAMRVTGKGSLVVGHNFEGIHLIDLKDGKQTDSLAFSKSAIFDLLIIQDYLLAGCGDGKIYLICLLSIRVIASFVVSDKSVRRMVLSPCKTMLAVSGSDCNLYIFKLNLENQDSSFIEKIQTIASLHTASIFAIAWPKNIITGARDTFLKATNPDNGDLEHKAAAHIYAINDIALHETKDFFASSSMDKTIKIWNSQTLQLLKVIDKARYDGHKNSINKIIWLPHPSQNLLVSASDDKMICLWKISPI